MQNIIEQIKQIMSERKISTYSLAAMVGSNQPKIQRIINSKSKFYDKDTIDKIIDVLGIAEPLTSYRATQVIEGLTPEEYEMIRIARECPEAVAVVRMMGAVDSDTQKDIQRSAEKEKLMYDLIKERRNKKSA